jgi:hypothetical protein
MYDSNGKPIGDLAVARHYDIPVYLAAPNGDLLVLRKGWIFRDYTPMTVRSGLPIDDTMFNCRR